jgi:hypothetical protein
METVGLSVIKVGSVVTYPRALDLFEGARRLYFVATRHMPHFAPQVFVLASKGK